jgi:HSP20 family protein
MMNTIRYEPWSLLNELQGQLNRFYDQQRMENGDHSNVVTSQWQPAVDIKEEDKRFVLFADLPGVDPEDIDIMMENGILTIKGERAPAGREDGKEYSRLERAHGRFHRRFSLPDTANADAIEARGEHGVLTIIIPKQEKIQPRRIEVAIS